MFRPATLTSLADFINGFAFKPEDLGAEGLPVIRIEQLKDRRAPFDFSTRTVPATISVKNGDLLFSWSASLFLQIWDRGQALLNQHLFKVNPRPDIDKRFLKYCIEFHLPALASVAHGSTMQHITRKDLECFQVMIPDTKVEQEQVAGILGLVDRAIEQTALLIAKYERVSAGLIKDLSSRGIDEKGRLRRLGIDRPAEWLEVPLAEVAAVRDPNPSHRYPPSDPQGVPIVSTENFVGLDDYDVSQATGVPWAFYEEQNDRCGFEEDDVVFARKGVIGFARPYGRQKKTFSHTVVVVKASPSIMSSRFLLWLLRSPMFFEGIRRQMNSNSGVPTLGVEFLRNVSVLVPSPKEQRLISSILDSVSAVGKEQVRMLAKLRAVKGGLMQDLLTGTTSVSPLLHKLAAITR